MLEKLYSFQVIHPLMGRIHKIHTSIINPSSCSQKCQHYYVLGCISLDNCQVISKIYYSCSEIDVTAYGKWSLNSSCYHYKSQRNTWNYVKKTNTFSLAFRNPHSLNSLEYTAKPGFRQTKQCSTPPYLGQAHHSVNKWPSL